MLPYKIIIPDISGKEIVYGTIYERAASTGIAPKYHFIISGIGKIEAMELTASGFELNIMVIAKLITAYANERIIAKI